MRAIVPLPAIATFVGPALILLFAGGANIGWGAPRPVAVVLVAIGAAVIAAGLTLIVWTIALFWRRGRGTLAPWDPPRKLVVEGPYHRVRNPMITGVATVLAGEVLVFGSPALVIYALTFVAVNALYMPRVEEPRLLARFGDEYADYMREVPRWIPRLGRRPAAGGSLSR